MSIELTKKIIFSGPMGAGKTTAITAISEIDPIKSDVKNNDTDLHGKTMTTMAMDYGMLTLEDGCKLTLYGTPGQERLKFMWPIVARGAVGVIILVANDHPDPVAAFDVYLDSFSDLIASSNAVIGITKTEINQTNNIADYQAHLHSRGLTLPVFCVDVRKPQDVLLLLNGLLSTCEVKRQQ